MTGVDVDVNAGAKREERGGGGKRVGGASGGGGRAHAVQMQDWPWPWDGRALGWRTIVRTDGQAAGVGADAGLLNSCAYFSTDCVLENNYLTVFICYLPQARC